MRAFLLFLAAMLAACALPAQAQKRIALSFDDAPRGAGAFLTREARTVRLIGAMARAKVPQAVFFVNPGSIRDAGDAAMLDAYVAAGHVLANHSNTHPHLNAMSAEAYLADVDKAEAWLKERSGYRPWFRYPFLDEGGRDKPKRDTVRAGLKARGLSNGHVTAEASDWNTEQLTIAAKQAGKTIDMAALRDLYVTGHVEAAEFADALMRRAIGRSPPHVMLLHETDIAALFLEDLVAALRAKGWEIVSADEAYRDPIYAALTDTPSAQGTLTEMLAWERNLPPPRWYEGNDIRHANARFAERVLHEKKP